MRSMLWIVVVAATVAACKGKDQASGQPGGQSAGQPGMGSMRTDSMPMGGGTMGIGSSAMRSMFRAHMDSLVHMSPEQMTGMMVAYDRLMSQMMDQMGTDMRRMKMSADAKWSALTDSVKADLADLPGLQGTSSARG